MRPVATAIRAPCSGRQPKSADNEDWMFGRVLQFRGKSSNRSIRRARLDQTIHGEPRIRKRDALRWHRLL
jgi:hypothetical protein